jgi:hypothetical protein
VWQLPRLERRQYLGHGIGPVAYPKVVEWYVSIIAL